MKPNHSGHAGERNIASALQNAGVFFKSQVVVGRSIYKYELRADFVCVNLAAYPRGIILESKWQDVAGTADEKFPLVVENIRTGCYPLPVIVVVHGGGCRPGALEWLRSCIDGRRLVGVLNLEELTSWALRAAKLPLNSLFQNALSR